MDPIIGVNDVMKIRIIHLLELKNRHTVPSELISSATPALLSSSEYSQKYVGRNVKLTIHHVVSRLITHEDTAFTHLAHLRPIVLGYKDTFLYISAHLY
jgi:hypothetical protein